MTPCIAGENLAEQGGGHGEVPVESVQKAGVLGFGAVVRTRGCRLSTAWGHSGEKDAFERLQDRPLVVYSSWQEGKKGNSGQDAERETLIRVRN